MVGSARPVVVPNPPVNVLTSGLAARRPQHTQAANQELVTTQAVQTAVALVSALLGPAPGEAARPQAAGPQQGQGGQDQQLSDSSGAAVIGAATTDTPVMPPLFDSRAPCTTR